MKSHKKDAHRNANYKETAVVDGIHVFRVKKEVGYTKHCTATLGYVGEQQ